MKKKIGIMTFHQSYNCGSILQALALETVLKEEGYYSECIDFSNIGQKMMYSIFDKRKSLKAVIKNCLILLSYKSIKTHYDDYQQFIDKYIVVGKKKYTYTNELIEMDKEYDAFIAGSDQVWNVKCYDADPAYFLSFVKGTKKIAFAPSLGAIDLRNEDINLNDYIGYLKDFDYLSCREKNGRSIIQSLTNRNVELIADPTLLFNMEEWNTLIPTANYAGKPFVFYYAFLYPNEVNKCVANIAKKRGFDVYVMDPKAYCLNALWRYGFKLTASGGPKEFIYRIKNASMVLTTSFHGTVFATLFHKEFIFLNSAMHDKTDDRASTLLQQLGLEDMYISTTEVEKCSMFNIDYKRVDENIELLRENSRKYLRNALEGI